MIMYVDLTSYDNCVVQQLCGVLDLEIIYLLLGLIFSIDVALYNYYKEFKFNDNILIVIIFLSYLNLMVCSWFNRKVGRKFYLYLKDTYQYKHQYITLYSNSHGFTLEIIVKFIEDFNYKFNLYTFSTELWTSLSKSISQFSWVQFHTRCKLCNRRVNN
jgi:hypothetical protein